MGIRLSEMSLIFTVSTRRYNKKSAVTFYLLHCSTRVCFLESIIRLFNVVVSHIAFHIARSSCHFICGLFNNAVNNSDYITPNNTMVNEYLI